MTLREWRNESELGAWTHLEFLPATHGSMVESVWLFEGALQEREQFYPTGTLDLLIQLGGSSPSFRVVDGQSTETPAAALTGMLLAPLTIETPAETSILLGARLRPAAAAALFELPQHLVTGSAVSLDDLIGAESLRLVERLCDAPSHVQRLRIMASWISARMAAGVGTEPNVGRAVAEIERARGAVGVADLLAQFDASPKRFRRSFEEQVGVTPKTFARIVRFRRTADALRRSDLALGEAAVAHGYYDQAHMNAEFRQFAGLSPGRFRAAVRPPGSEGIFA
jgi:AraC-like DNA-binding protein